MRTQLLGLALVASLPVAACGGDDPAPAAEGAASPSASPSASPRASLSPPPRPAAGSVPPYDVFEKLSGGAGNLFSVAVDTDDQAALQLILEDIRATNARAGQHRITYFCRSAPEGDLGIVGYGKFAFGEVAPGSLLLADGATQIELDADASCPAG